jgi:hypothetical protein
MLYFVRGAVDFTVCTVAPAGVIYPEIALNADQKVKLVDQRPPCVSYKFPPVRVYAPSLLKSNLQKAIRRRHGEEAFATAKHLLAQDPNELLRRLPVLMNEDAQLHPRLFQEIVWLMAAVSKGYRLCGADCQRVVDFVGACLSAPCRYNLHVGASGTRIHAEDPLQLAFLLRIAYGGMEFDVGFLTRLAERVGTGELPTSDEVLCVEYERVTDFDPERHLLPEAIDFHCFPSMPAETGVPKLAIWHGRSAWNVRPFVGLEADAGARAIQEGVTEWPLSDRHLTAIEDFVETTVARLRGKPPSPPMAKQMRLTGFVKRDKTA